MLTGTRNEEAVDVAATRVDGSYNLICFANANAANRCIRIGIDPHRTTWIPDLNTDSDSDQDSDSNHDDHGKRMLNANSETTGLGST